MKRTNSGYSLVEVLIAMAITTVVLLTVVTLFYMGKRNVYSGKQQTYAVSVGTRIMEDLSTLTLGDVESDFAIDDTTALGIVTVQQVDYAASATRDTSSCTAAATPPPAFTCTNDTAYFLSAWKSLIDPTKLTNAKVGLILTPTAPTDPAKKWTSATFLKVRAYIQWDETKGRRRIAYFDTTTINRQ